MIPYPFERIRVMQKEKNLAVVLAGGMGSLAIIRELGKQEVPVVAIGQATYAIRSKYCLSLPISNKQQMLSFLLTLPGYVDHKPVLMTDNDGYLELLQKNWPQLSSYYLAPFHPNNLQITEKNLLVGSAEQVGIKTPKSWLGAEQKDVCQFPALVKPVNRDQFFSVSESKPQKVYECNNREELLRALQLMEDCNIESVTQQIVPGCVENQYSITLYRDPQGKIMHGFTVQKIRQYPMDYGTATVHLECRRPILEEYSIRLLESVNYVGIAMIEYKYCEQAKDYYIIEVNGRFPLETGIVHKLNSLFVYRIYLNLIGRPTSGLRQEPSFRRSVVWFFFLNDLRNFPKTGWRFLLDYLQYPVRYKLQDAVWSWSDPLPLFSYLKFLAKKYLKSGSGIQ